MNWYLGVFKKYAVFSGRAQRMEFWMFSFVNTAIWFGIGFVAGYESILATIYALLIVVPWLAVTVRRLHDSGRSGWWILVCFVPFIGWAVNLFFMVLDSEPGTNLYGPNPKVELAV